MPKTYFEERGPELLEIKGMSKAEFARRMGIRRQNVNTLFKTNNLYTIHKAAQVLGVPFAMLIGYTSAPDILPAEIPSDETVPSAFGPFGNIYFCFEGRPKDAFWFLIDHQEGDLRDVFIREDIGPIDLVWGDNHYGVRHILTKQINKKDFPTINIMIERISSIIQDGELVSKDANSATLKQSGYQAIIQKNVRTANDNLDSETWVLATYRKEIVSKMCGG